MIHQIIITDEEGMRVLEAVVDVKRRRVTQLSLEENYPAVVSAFVGLATLSAVIEGELVAEDARMKSPGVPVNGTLKREQQTQQLTREQMATAMGLVSCRAEWDSSCEMCDEASIDWMRREGQVLIGWCSACLPAAYDAHVIEQGELDRLVEADDGLKPELRTEKRAADLECEGGARPL
jgi:hypothetical protein